ncbi:MAG: transglycosylase SLT domain-containing protein [Streptosporangiales bacterium]|nr:transglycosylase SLT domain-containing protein [Streptosporangiales bacterium]
MKDPRVCTAWVTALAVALALGIAGCGGSEGAPGSAASGSSAPATEPRGSPTETPTTSTSALPTPDAPIPRDPSRLADTLARTTAALERAIDDWLEHGDPARGRPPKPVVFLALHQQRMYRFLARHHDLARRTIAELPRPLAAPARDNVTASRKLFSLTSPISKPSAFRTQQPRPAGVLLTYFKRAERRFDVSWQVLAAVMYVETKFGRVKSASSAGAQGPMQFMPSTWDSYGMGGDVHDPNDAVLAAANYLHASGAPEDYRRALHAYNPDGRYVEAVLRHARQIRRDQRNYYAYYNWQVFVLTTRGDRRLTGP